MASSSSSSSFVELVHSESHDTSETELPIITTNDLKPINNFIPSCHTSYLAFLRDNYSPTARQISTCTCLSMEEMTAAHMDDMYFPLAKKALAYYNAKEDSNLSLMKVTVGAYQSGPSAKVHINFIATTEDGIEELLFSELVTDRVQKFKARHTDEFHVNGCSLLKVIEPGNPIGRGCSMCGVEVFHPGPRHGCLILGGDLFESASFWGYRYPPSMDEPTPDHQDMYSACAMKALEYFNSKQSSSHFMPVEVVGSFTAPCPHKTVVHVNFKCITNNKPDQDIFFAELIVPSFTVDFGVWDSRKEPFIIVKGCCLLEKVDSGKHFGRVCEVCYCIDVIHPGPKDGYRVAVGDAFTGYGFMNIGLGTF